MRVIVEEIEALVSRAGKHPIWGYTHCKRVLALAQELAGVKSGRGFYEYTD